MTKIDQIGTNEIHQIGTNIIDFRMVDFYRIRLNKNRLFWDHAKIDYIGTPLGPRLRAGSQFWPGPMRAIKPSMAQYVKMLLNATVCCLERYCCNTRAPSPRRPGKNKQHSQNALTTKGGLFVLDILLTYSAYTYIYTHIYTDNAN